MKNRRRSSGGDYDFGYNQPDKLLFCGQRPRATSPRTDQASGAERHTVTNQLDKLLFEE